MKTLLNHIFDEICSTTFKKVWSPIIAMALPFFRTPLARFSLRGKLWHCLEAELRFFFSGNCLIVPSLHGP
jgi:hypothetical protein